MDGKLFVLCPREDPLCKSVKRGWYTSEDEDWEVVFPEDGKDPKDCYYRVVSSVPRIEEQKYLVGPRIHGEERGEEQADEYYINCLCETTQSSIHFRILVDQEGRFWITKGEDSSATQRIQINGEELTVEKGAVSLSFGDKIAVHAEAEGIFEKNKEIHFFRFDMDEKPYPTVVMDLDEEQYFFHGYIHKGLTVIFHEILSYLGPGDLEQARLVNHRWEEEATKILLSRAVINLRLKRYEEEMQLCRLTLLRFANQMGSFTNNIKNLKISLPLMTQDFDPFSDTEISKLVHDFKRYFLSLEGFGGGSVKSLDIEGETWEEGFPVGTFWRGCFEKFPNLEELSMNVIFRFDRNFLPHFSSLIWPNLRAFKLSGDHCGSIDEGPEDLPGIKEWIGDCLKAVKEIKTLDISDFPYAHFFVEEMNRKDGGGLVNLPKLTELSIDLRSGGQGNSFQLLSHLGAMRTGLLTSLTLSMWGISAISPNNWKKLFAAQAPTLRNLDIDFGRRFVGSIEMPSVFPKLERLKIKYSTREFNLIWGDGNAGGSMIDYVKTFPNLKDLTIIPSIGHVRNKDHNVWEIFYEWEGNEALWNSFFGNGISPCQTLKNLGIPHLTESMLNGTYYYGDFIAPRIIPSLWYNEMLKYIEEVKRIAVIFPNARNNWVLKIKKMPDEPADILSHFRNTVPIL